MSVRAQPRAASMVADLDIETPAGDRLSLCGDGGELRLAAASVGALWRSRRGARVLLHSGVARTVLAGLAVDVSVRVKGHVVARVEPTTRGRSRVRLRWFALLRALF